MEFRVDSLLMHLHIVCLSIIYLTPVYHLASKQIGDIWEKTENNTRDKGRWEDWRQM